MRTMIALFTVSFYVICFSAMQCCAMDGSLLPAGELKRNHDPEIPLCEEASDPEGTEDKVHVHCGMEYGSFAARPGETGSSRPTFSRAKPRSLSGSRASTSSLWASTTRTATSSRYRTRGTWPRTRGSPSARPATWASARPARLQYYSNLAGFSSI